MSEPRPDPLAHRPREIPTRFASREAANEFARRWFAEHATVHRDEAGEQFTILLPDPLATSAPAEPEA